MKERIEYIDQLKGLAIILVVMGHVAEKSMNITGTPFYEFYTSFHMPLFMFLSGNFAFKSFKDWNISEAINFLKRKALRILLPFIVIGGAYSLLYYNDITDVYWGTSPGYWFLPALFYCMIYGLTIYSIINNIQWLKNSHWSLGIHLISYVILTLIYYKGNLENIPYLLHAIKMYPYFLIGTFFTKHTTLKNKVAYSNNLFTIAIIGYICALIYKDIIPIKLNYTGFFAIIILINLFINCNQYIPKKLSFIGKYSLEIYVFHYFFLPTLSSLGNWIIAQNTNINQNFIILFSVTSIIAAPIIFICILLAMVIHNSRLLNAICFGALPQAKNKQ